MGQVKVDFLDTIGNKAITGFNIDLAAVHQTIEDSLAHETIPRYRVKWQEVNLALGDIWRIRDFITKMELLRLDTVLPRGGTRLSGKNLLS